MTNIEFENQLVTPTVYAEKPKTGLVGLVMRLGIVKTEKQATLLFIVVIIISLSLIGYNIFSPSKTNNIVPTVKIESVNQNQFMSQ
jgi:hypothetical protein